MKIDHITTVNKAWATLFGRNIWLTISLDNLKLSTKPMNYSQTSQQQSQLDIDIPKTFKSEISLNKGNILILFLKTPGIILRINLKFFKKHILKPFWISIDNCLVRVLNCLVLNLSELFAQWVKTLGLDLPYATCDCFESVLSRIHLSVLFTYCSII